MSPQAGKEAKGGHTPGPWSCAQVWRGPETKVHAEFEGRRVALAEVFTMHAVGEKEANARLIAAAPELLVTLRRFITAAKSWHDFHHGSETVQCDWLCECIAPGEAAIAKAEGRS